jgi:signal transduction histidine kinase
LPVDCEPVTNTPSHRSVAPNVGGYGVRLALLALTYVIAWILLWFGAAWMNLAVGVSLWYPPAGLTFAVLLAYGVRAFPLPVLASLLAGVSIWSREQWPYFLLANLVCPLGYLSMAHLLRADWGPCRRETRYLDDPRGVAVFLAAAALGGLFSAVTGSGILRLAGLWAPGQSWSETMLGFWVGDLVGVATVAPLVLLFGVPLAGRFLRGSPLRLSASPGAQPYPLRLALVHTGISAALLLLLFGELPRVWPVPLHPYMALLLLPVLGWVVMSRSMRTTVVIVFLYELGILVMVSLFGEDHLSFQYQLVMAAVVASGLMTGAASHARLATNARFRDFAESSNDVLWETDASGRLREIVGSLRRSAAPVAGLVGRHWRDCVLHRQEGTDFGALRRAVSRREPFRHLVLCLHLSEGQQPLWTLNNGLPRFDDDGAFVGYRGTTSDISELKEAEQALRESRDALKRRVDQLARLTSQLTLTEQRERHRLALVLHDHLQQLLVAATMGLDSLGNRVGAECAADLEHVRSLLGRSIDATRLLAVDLSPPVLREAGLPEALAWLARTMERNHGLRVALSIASQVSPEREDVRIVVFESVREALFNVVKHARVAQAELELIQRDPGFITVVIRDHGVGIEPDALANGNLCAGGFGLFAMRERLSLLGGGLKIDTAPGGGTQVTLFAPITASTADGSTEGGADPSPTVPEWRVENEPRLSRIKRAVTAPRSRPARMPVARDRKP